ncbi:MAG: hypothetical protein ACOCUD_04560 [Bacillota bacterium]
MIFFSATQMFQSAFRADKKILMLATGLLSFIFNIGIAVVVILLLDFANKKLKLVKIDKH